MVAGEFSPVLLQPLFGKREEGEILVGMLPRFCNGLQIH
jgi:hypothetical protein